MLSKEALVEMRDLTDWLLRLEYTPEPTSSGEQYPTFTLENICYKIVDTDPTHPCFVNSMLDCFREGNVGVLGGDNNTDVWRIYNERPTFADPNFTMSTDFTASYHDQYCMYWFQLGYPWRSFAGGVDWYLPGDEKYDPSVGDKVIDWDWEKEDTRVHPVTSEAVDPAAHDIDALRIVMASYDEMALHEKGLRFTEWEETETCVELDVLVCPAPECAALKRIEDFAEGDSPITPQETFLSEGCDCFECVLSDQALHPVLIGALGSQCIPDASVETQLDSCCDYMAETGAHPCAPHLYKFSTSVLTYGSFVNRQCGLPVPNLGGRCNGGDGGGERHRSLLATMGVGSDAEMGSVDPEAASLAREELRALVQTGTPQSAAAVMAAMADAGMTLREAMGVALGEEEAQSFWGEMRKEVINQRLTRMPGADTASDEDFWAFYHEEVRSNVLNSAARGRELVEGPMNFGNASNATNGTAYGNGTATPVAYAAAAVLVPLDLDALANEARLAQLAEDMAERITLEVVEGGGSGGNLDISVTTTVITTTEIVLHNIDQELLNLTDLAASYAREAGLRPSEVEAKFANDGEGSRRSLREDDSGINVEIAVALPLESADTVPTLADTANVEALATVAATRSLGEGVTASAVGESSIQLGMDVVIATFDEDGVASVQNVQPTKIAEAAEAAAEAQGFDKPAVEYAYDLPDGVVANIEPEACGYDSQPDAPWAAEGKCGCGAVCHLNYNGKCFADKTYTRPNLRVVDIATEEDALELIKGWERNWLKEIENLFDEDAELDEQERRFKVIKPTYLAGSSVEDTIADATVAQIPLLIVGYVLVTLFSIGYYAVERGPDGSFRASKLGPSWWVVLGAILSIIVSVFASLGISALLSQGTPVKYNALTLQVVPFLGVGLGINDFYIAAASFQTAAAARASPARTPVEVTAEAMRIGGTSITLSSLTNMFAFFLGALIPVPAVSDYAVQVAFVILTNWVVAITLFPFLLYTGLKNKQGAIQQVADEEQARKNREAEEAAAATKDPAGATRLSLLESMLRNELVKVGVLLVYLALMAVCIAGLFDVEKGLSLSDAVPKDKKLHDYAVNAEEYFTSSTVWLVVRDVGTLDERATSVALREMDYNFVQDTLYMDTDYECTNFLRYFTDYVEGKIENDEICFDEVYYYKDRWLEHRNECAGKEFPMTAARRGADGSEELGRVESCQEFCEGNFARKSLSPNPDEQCEYSEPINPSGNMVPTCHCPWRPLPLQWHEPVGGASESLFDHFLHTDIKGRISRAITHTEFEGTNRTTFGKVTNARILTFANDVNTVAKRVDHINSARGVMEEQDFNAQQMRDTANAYPFDWTLYALNEQYLHIDDNAIFGIAMSVLAGFVVMLPLIVHPGAALIVVSLLVLVEIELYGLLPYFGMKLNSVVLVNLISAIGIAVEFHAHIARAFMLAEGDRVTRVVAALGEVGNPVLCGAVTDFLAIVAIAFSYFDYFVLYFFIQFTMIIVVCMVNALVLLPILLTWIGPPAYEGEEDDEDAESKAKKGMPADVA